MSFVRLAPEQHDTLEGIPEPSETANLAGHTAAVGAIIEAYRAGRLPHALLLTGPRGIGKATLAFQVARHLLANPDPGKAPDDLQPADPSDRVFRQIASGSHLSVLHVTRSYNDKTKKFMTILGVDEVRRIGRFLSMTAHDGAYRVVIVDPADDMNVNAANALLKRLEEPPEKTLFLLLSHSPGRLLPTIRSRCQMLRLAPLGEAELKAALDATGAISAAAQLPEILARAEGSVRAALLLSEFGGMEIVGAVDRLLGTTGIDTATLHRLAEAVAGRENGILFDLMNDHLLLRLSEASTDAAAQGAAERAGALARAWDEMLVAIRDAGTYNLDRKQHALTMILKSHRTFRM
jgi:DNA polymerase-3 subunit delta'